MNRALWLPLLLGIGCTPSIVEGPAGLRGEPGPAGNQGNQGVPGVAGANGAPATLTPGAVTTPILADRAVTPEKLGAGSEGQVLAVLDGGAAWVSLPPPPAYGAGPGLVLSASTFAIAAQGVSQAMLADQSVANAQVLQGSLNSDRLAASGATTGDALKFDGTRWVPLPDQNTTYTATNGVTLTGSQFSADTAVLQARVSGACLSGSSIRQVNANGSVLCQTDANNTYTAGTGLALTGGAFSVDATVQRRVSGACAAGSMVRAVAADGTVTCDQDGRLGGGSSSNVVATAGPGCTWGEVKLFAGNFPPQGWLFADGRLLPLSGATAALFSLLGINFGGNATTNFGLPDLRAAAPRSANGTPVDYIICVMGPTFPSRN